MHAEPVTTGASTERHLINVSLIYWKHSTDITAAFLINTAKSLLRQHGTYKKERATLAALMTFPFSGCQLLPNIALFEVNKVKPSELACQMGYKTRSLHSFYC
jgi:hypothetical protein